MQTEQIGTGKIISFRLASSSFVLVSGGGPEVAHNIIERSATHPYALNLATGTIDRHVPGSTPFGRFAVGEPMLALLMQHWGNR